MAFSKVVCSSFLLLLAALPAWAAEYERCYQAGNTIEINDCLSDEFGKVNEQLNQIYGKTIKALAPEAREALTEAQRAWTEFRDKDCRAVYEFWKAGTIRTTKAIVCRIEKTGRRISELRQWPPN